MFGYTLAGLGTMLLGASWLMTGFAIARGKQFGKTPSPQTPTQLLNRRILGGAIMLFGLTFVYYGSRLAYTGGNSDLQQMYYLSGPMTCSPITIYTLRGCPWCSKAMEELQAHNLPFKEVEYTREMFQNPNSRPPRNPAGQVPNLFPEIWLGSRNMGGYSEMINWIENCK